MTSYAALRTQAIAFLLERTKHGEVLLLTNSADAGGELALEACSDALIGVHAIGFRDFVRAVSAYEMNRRGLTPVGRIIREAIAARVAAQGKKELSYLAPVASFPGFPRALTDTFEELRLNQTPLDRLRACGRSGPDLALLLEAYRHELDERALADHATRVELAVAAVAAGTHRFGGLPVLCLDLALHTAAERELLAALLSSAPAALDLRINSSAGEVRSSLESVQRYALSNEAAPPRPADGSVEIFSASGEALECTEIARRIGDLAERGVPFDQIAILVRSPERYQPLVIEAMRRAAVPVHCARSATRPDPVGRSFLALLHCAAEKLSAARFAEYLSMGQVPEEEEPVTPAAWERLLVDAAVIGGADRWRSRLEGLENQLRLGFEGAEDEDTRGYLARRIAAVETLARVALPIIERLAALPARATWGEWIEALDALAQATLREPDRVQALLDELAPMSEIGPVSLDDVLLVVGDRLQTLSEPPRDGRFGKIFVAGIEEARGMSFRVVFLPGVNEGLFPRPPAEDPLLLEEQRRALGIDLRPDDAELLRIAARCTSEQLVLSFSRLDLLTGRSRVPSFYAFDAHRAAGGPDLDVHTFENLAADRATTRIGWPAPRNAADAIDDAEFDLATLAGREKGSGEYLKRLPGRAVYSLRHRWERWHQRWKPADGLIIEEIGNDALERYRPAARAWSPSMLQQYARCPYRFVLRAIHELRPAERPTGIQRLDPLTRGDLYHRIQFELLRDLRQRGLLPVEPTNLEEILTRLDAALEKVATAAAAELAPAIPQVWNAGVDSIRADLRGWLQHKAQMEPDWTPEFFELAFGLEDRGGRDPRSDPKPVELEDGFLLRGAIDLVERHSSGVLRVVDHKTGGIPAPKPEMVGGGEALQPALYAMAAEKLLGESVATGRLFYSTIAQNYQTIDIPLQQWTRHRTLQVLRMIDDSVHQGFLPAAPRKDACKGCEYLPVCGPYEEERVHAKSQPELKALKELRLWK
ncbi:MAG TPA: PD-(D/E)XK nuclease family protein [Bryobacteraceae bacterium]